MDVFGYREEFKEAKRLISEGRAQLSSAERLDEKVQTDVKIEMCNNIPYIHNPRLYELGSEQYNKAIENITGGLEIYRDLLSSDNTEHFTRIKKAIKGTILEFKDVLMDCDVERYTNCLCVGAE